MSRIEIVGTPIDPYSQQETVEKAAECIEEGGPHVIATVNLRSVMLARNDPAFAEMIRRSEIVVADGMPLVWFSRLSGVPLQERVTGVDLIPALCAMAAKKGYRVFFLGAGPGIADELGKRMRERFPNLEVCGTYSPPLSFETDENTNRDVIERIRAARPQILFAAMGTPRQELWLDRHREDLGVPLTIGVGAGFDFLTGNQKRAPIWMQEAGLEWLYRLVTRPVEMSKRTLRHGPLFIMLVLDQLTYRFQRSAVLRVRPIVLGISDAFVAVCAWFLSYFLYFRSGLLSLRGDPFPDHSLFQVPGYTDLLPFAVLLTLVGLYRRGLYSRDPERPPGKLLMRIVGGVITGLFFLIVYAFVDKTFIRHQLKGFSRGMFALFGLCSIGGLFITRTLLRWLGRLMSRLSIDVDRILVVGDPGDEEQLQELIATQDRGWRVLGYLDDQPEESTKSNGGLEYLGTVDDIKRILHGRKVDEVLALNYSPGDKKLSELARICASVNVRLSLLPRGFELMTYSSEVRHRGGLRLISINPRKLRERD